MMVFLPKLPICIVHCLKVLASQFASEQKANTIVYHKEKTSGYHGPLLRQNKNKMSIPATFKR